VDFGVADVAPLVVALLVAAEVDFVALGVPDKDLVPLGVADDDLGPLLKKQNVRKQIIVKHGLQRTHTQHRDNTITQEKERPE
jgi:predicted ATPase